MIACAASGCASQNGGDASSEAETTAPTAAAASTGTTAAAPETTAAAEIIPEGVAETIEAHAFEGVIYAVENGQPVAAYAKGTLENDTAITLDTPMPLGSVSKQFCAAAIMLLQEQGKLSTSDTLDKYFPDYAEGSKITLHNLLSMRSGIAQLTGEDDAAFDMENTEAQNVAAIKEWVFRQPLQFTPDKSYAYANINYFLLAEVVEQVSGKPYVTFLRDSFFTPLGMTHTGSLSELAGNPAWAQGNGYEPIAHLLGITKGSGDLISNAADVTTWLNALSSGKAVSAESYKAMTTDYSSGEHYGYGLEPDSDGGVGHNGAIQIYSAFDYINTDKKLTLVTMSNTIEPMSMTGFSNDLLSDLMP